MSSRRWAAAAVWSVCTMSGYACRPVGGEKDAVDVTYAASLAATMGRLESAFRARTGRGVRGDPRGSVAGAHLIREGIWPRDVYITADPATLELLGPRNPGWAVAFAQSEIVLGYSASSRFALALDSAARGEARWYEVALRPGFRLGRTDPELDPKGYRAIFAFRLAEQHYDLPGLESRLLAGPAGLANVYPEEHLSARVQTGSLDAAVFYLAEAAAHGLRAIRLPRLPGQGDTRDVDSLASLEYRSEDGHRFRGAPVLYAATIPLDAPDSAAGAQFVTFLIRERGRAVLEEDGFRTQRVLLGDEERVPDWLFALLDGGGPESRAAPEP